MAHDIVVSRSDDYFLVFSWANVAYVSNSETVVCL